MCLANWGSNQSNDLWRDINEVTLLTIRFQREFYQFNYSHACRQKLRVKVSQYWVKLFRSIDSHLVPRQENKDVIEPRLRGMVPPNRLSDIERKVVVQKVGEATGVQQLESAGKTVAQVEKEK